MRLQSLWLVACLAATAGCPEGARIVRAGADTGGGSSAGGPATRLAFIVTPSTASAGVTIDPAAQVAAQDSAGVTDTVFTGTVTIGLGSHPDGATLTGTLTVTAVRGVATFSDLRIDRAGSGYTFTASAISLIGATSTSFTVQ
ncbi:MAG: hypothetical protein AUH46_03985 [Gemmatimonadetes bacterium 13_1_40CM_70_15]|nr:MAG: hypothetical protein AUH46_03985 [Gemmatimonadetes bacterium 13_1_40CM_70_15]